MYSLQWLSAGTKHRISWNGCPQSRHMALCLAQCWVQAEQNPWRQKGTQAVLNIFQGEGALMAPPGLPVAHAAVPCSCRSGLMLSNAVSCQESHVECWSFPGAEKRRGVRSPESCGGSPHGSPQQLPSFQATWGEMSGEKCGELSRGHLRGDMEPPSPQSTVLFTRHWLD